MPQVVRVKRKQKQRGRIGRVVAFTEIRGHRCDEYADDDVVMEARMPGGARVRVKLSSDEQGAFVEVRALTPDNPGEGTILLEPSYANLVRVRFR